MIHITITGASALFPTRAKELPLGRPPMLIPNACDVVLSRARQRIFRGRWRINGSGWHTEASTKLRRSPIKRQHGPLVMSRVVTLLEPLQTLVTLQGTSQSQHFEWMNGRVGHFAGEAIVCGEEISAHQHAP